MKNELKKRWISALRSGKYKQTSEYLCDDRGWCCLGVLCDLVDSSRWSEVDEDEHTYARSYRFDYNTIEREFPDYDWLNDIGLDLNIARYLAASNDEGESFNTLADFIEESVHAVD